MGDELCCVKQCKQEDRIKRIEKDIEENDKKRGELHKKNNETDIKLTEIKSELEALRKDFSRVFDWVESKKDSQSKNAEKLGYKIVEWIVIAIVSYAFYKVTGI